MNNPNTVVVILMITSNYTNTYRSSNFNYHFQLYTDTKMFMIYACIKLSAVFWFSLYYI